MNLAVTEEEKRKEALIQAVELIATTLKGIENSLDAILSEYTHVESEKAKVAK